MAAGYVYSLKDNIPYGQHAQNNRYIAEISRKGTGASKAGAKIIARAQEKSGKMMSDSLTQASKAQEQRLIQINSAVVDQTRIMGMGMKVMDNSLKDGFYQVSNELQSISQSMNTVNETILMVGNNLSNGISSLKSSFDMGMAAVVSQFELQRKELKEGLENVADILKNRRKTEAMELFNDAKTEFENFLQFPEEIQFLNDSFEYLTKSIEIYKGNPYVYLYLGHAYKEYSEKINPNFSLDNYKTCATYAKGIRNDNLAAFGYFLAGWMSYVCNDVNQAVELTLLSIQFDGQSYPEAYYNLAKFYAFQGNTNESLKYLDIAIKQFDPHYSVKPFYDNDFNKMQDELSKYYKNIRDEEKLKLENKLSSFIGK
jgi:tetratricopeptide (TPR) repeat protein